MTRTLALALALVFVACPNAMATTETVDDAGNVVGISEEPFPGDLPDDEPDIDVPCDGQVPTIPCGAIGVLCCSTDGVGGRRHMAKMKKSRAQGHEALPGGIELYSAYIDVMWHRDRWRVLPGIGKDSRERVGTVPNLAWAFDGWSDWVEYDYQYKGHGMGSGHVVQRTAKFKLCIPTKFICMKHTSIDLRLNLHADGTVHRVVKFNH